MTDQNGPRHRATDPQPVPGYAPVDGQPGSRFADVDLFVVFAYLGCAVVLGIGFVISFVSFKAASVRVGIDAPVMGGMDLSHLMPLSVDALAIVASIVLVAPGITKATRDYAMNTLIGSVVASVAVNSFEHFMHAIYGATTPGWLWIPTILIGGIAPVSVAIATHLVVTMRGDRKAAADRAAQEARDAQAARVAEAAENARRENERLAKIAARQARTPTSRVQARAERTDRPIPRTITPTPTTGTGPGPAPGTAEAKIRAAITAHIAAGGKLADLSASDLGVQAGVAKSRGRKIVAKIRHESMLTYLTQAVAQGRTLADVVVPELVDQFGGEDDAALAALADAAGQAATTQTHQTHPSTSSEGR